MVARDCYWHLVSGSRNKRDVLHREENCAPTANRAFIGKHWARLRRPFKAMPRNLDFSLKKDGGENKESRVASRFGLGSWLGSGSNH